MINHTTILLSFLFASMMISKGAGVAIIDNLDHSGKQVVVYNRIDTAGESDTIILYRSGGKLVIRKSSLVDHIDVLDATPSEISSESDISIIRSKYEAMEAFSKKFPESKALLANQKQALQAIMKNLARGQVRLDGKWITKAEYTRRESERLAEAESRRKQQEEERVQESIQREEEQKQMKAFAESQRAKGLELYGGKWLNKSEIAQLQREETARNVEKREIEQAQDLVLRKTIKDAYYRVFQVIDQGLLVQVIEGKVYQGGISTDLVFIADAATGSAAEGDRYKGPLYWAGTYTYTTESRRLKTINAYCVNEDTALLRARISLNEAARGVDATESDSGEGSGVPVPTTDPYLPEPLRGARSFGSGFFVGQEGYFVTNAHVVKNASNIFILYSGQKIEVVLVAVDDKEDLALLRSQTPMPGLEILSTEGEIGQDVFALGFPNPEVQGLEIKVTKGVISSQKGILDDEKQYQIDAAIQAGNSGGPLCDGSGKLLGVVTAKLNYRAVASNAGELPQNVNYAIKSSRVLAMLKARGISTKTSQQEGNVKSAATATALVIVH